MIVVDTNVIAFLFLPGDDTAGAEAWLKSDRDRIAPLPWRSEFRVLGGGLRPKQLTFEAALAIQRGAEVLLIGSEHDVESNLAITPFGEREKH